ncbi:MAG: hypothetical protein JOZ18_01605 [Chloroflexi bacterium]|nr:hypothetical protein [Chloroflexota bacterium]
MATIDMTRAGYVKKKLQNKQSYWLGSLLLLLVMLSMSACGGQGSQSKTTPTSISSTQTIPPRTSDAIILEMLNNIKTYGYNANPAINNGLGGLWVNWRYGTNPLQANMNGSGVPDSNLTSPRHDPLTDIRYVHALWLYKSLHPKDTQFDGEIARYTAILKYEFANPQNDRGWLYDMFIDLYRLSNDTFYKQTAYSLARYFYTNLYQPAVGAVYKTNAEHPHGFSRVDLELAIGCALIQAGAVFNEPAWGSAGQRLVQTVYSTAYLPQYHVLLTQVDNVLLPDGRLNPNPSIFRGRYGNTQIEGGSVRLGAVALEILSLLHVYIVTHDQAFLNHAIDMLTPLTIDQNLLGLWDTERQGYFASATFTGPDFQHPGIPKINRKLKESGRQIQMLEAFRVANSLTGDRYQVMQDALLDVAVKKAYYAPGHGVLYEETADWQPVKSKNGQPQDWVTTEAMGITLESLFSVTEAQPW